MTHEELVTVTPMEEEHLWGVAPRGDVQILPDPLSNDADALAVLRWLVSQDVSFELWCDHIVARVWTGNAREEIHYAECGETDPVWQPASLRSAIVDAAWAFLERQQQETT